MLPIKKKRRLVVLLSLVVMLALGIDLITDHLNAKEASPKQGQAESFRDAEVVSDLSPEEMAREILVIQDQLGGSIVPQPEPLQRWQLIGDLDDKALITDREPHHNRRATLPTNPRFSAQQHKRVEVLREAAFNLDRTAHELERLDLYEQADSLRNVASRLRRDARELKQRTSSQPSENSQYLIPPPTAP